MNDWTLNTLRIYLQKQIDDLSKLLDFRMEAAEKAVATAMTAAEKAASKLELASEKRFEATNEFRGQLTDQASTFMPRTEVAAIQERLQERITDLQDRMNRLNPEGAPQRSEENSRQSSQLLSIVAVLVSAAAVVVLLLK
jgi:hypothetical protein